MADAEVQVQAAFREYAKIIQKQKNCLFWNKSLKMCDNVRTRSNASEHIRTYPDKSRQVPKHRNNSKTCENIEQMTSYHE